MNMTRDYIDFQDRSAPVGFLITFRTYGSWLHGDKRGSVDRRTFNRVRDPKRPPNESLKASDKAFSRSRAFRLSERLRKLVESAINEVCKFKGVALYAVNVRSNHVHVVVSAGIKPEILMTAMKAYATRAMRGARMVSASEKIWSRHGSTKYLWTDEQIESAIAYVKFEQGID